MKPLFVFCLLVCLAVPALAQESPKSELFAGYSYLRTDEGDIDLLQLTGIPGTATREGANLHGFNVGITYNLQQSFGFVLDIGGAFGTVDYTVNAQGVTGAQGVRTNLYTFLFGPQFYLRKDRYALFGRGMVGLARTNQKVFVSGQGFSANDTAFAAGFGGGLDVHFGEKISARLFQADYILTRFEDFQAGDRVQGAVRVSTGLVFR
jgi:hypothetical protein